MTTKKKLHGPASDGDLKTVKELVELGADVNEPNPYGVRPIFSAFCSSNEDLIQYLIEKGADVYYSIEENSFPDCLGCALKENNAKWVAWFLQNGVNPNVTNSRGENLLYRLFAHKNYDVPIHKLLLDAGCNPETKAPLGSALDYLKNVGIAELNDLYSKYLDKIEINPEVKDIRDQYGPSILFETIEKGTAKDLRTLIDQNPGMDLNKRDKTGNSALGLAILRKKKDSAKILLEKGADPTFPTLSYDDSTPALGLAQEWVERGIPKFQEIVDLIKSMLEKNKENVT